MRHTMCQVTPHLTSKHSQGSWKRIKSIALLCELAACRLELLTNNSLNHFLELFGMCVLSLFLYRVWGCSVVTRFYRQHSHGRGEVFSWFLTTYTTMITNILKIVISLFNYLVDQFVVLSSNSFWFYSRTRLDCESLMVSGSICEQDNFWIFPIPCRVLC